MKSTLTPLQSLAVLSHASLLTLCSTNYLHAAEPVDDSISKAAVTEQARKREISAEEDPAVKREADRLKGLTRWLDEPNKLDLYGSVRIRYRNNNDDSPWSDGGSRAGVSLHYQIMPHRWFNFRYEVGFNVLSQVNSILSAGESGGESGDSNVFNRLLYIGIETPSLVATFGKNWSSYYKVASFTDRFATY